MKAILERLISSRAAKLVALALLVGLLVWNVDFAIVVRNFRWKMLTGAILIQPFIIAGYFFNSVRFVLLVREPRIPIRIAFKALMLSYGLHTLLPARVAEIVKATFIRDHAGVALGQGMAAVFLERIVDLIYVGLLCAFSVGLLLSRSYVLAVVLIGIAGASLAGMAVLEAPLTRLARRLRWGRLRDLALQFIGHVNLCLRTRAFYLAFVVGAVVWTCACASVVVMLSWTGSIPVGVGGAIVVFVASAIGGAVPALPGGLGTYEAAVVLALKGFGYETEEAIALAIALHAGQLLLSFVGALVIVTLDRTGVRSLLRDVVRAHADEVPSRRTGRNALS